MHLIIGKAAVTTPTTAYSNAYVELDSVDDVVLVATVRNRQGVDLEVISGPFDVIATPAGGWIIHRDGGDVAVVPQTGCGCGGTSVLPVEAVVVP